jgi:ribosomal protein S21
MAKRPVNVSVSPRGKRDTQERMIRRFIRKCKKARIVEQVRELQYYEKPSTVRRKEAKKRKKVLDKLKIKEQNS